ncbi:MAG: class I SAM-dependent methyltransferase [Bacteroidota bacterium]|nr:MAG: class I SAM-dependent methyltransferase [Bacteroidota bacterium]
MDLDIYNETYDTICTSDIKQNAKILEVGCRSGKYYQLFIEKRPDFKILGIDSAPNMIEIAKRNNPSAEFLQFDARNIYQLNDKFDLIVSGFVYHTSRKKKE